MDFKHVPSLEYLSCVKISAGVINDPDVRKLDLRTSSGGYSHFFDNPNVRRLDLDPSFDKFPQLLETVIDILDDKISALTLPKICYRKIRNIVLNMICEVIRWRNNHFTIVHPSLMPMVDLSWTNHGTIDELKTALKLLQRPYLDTESRFLLACKYCFFEDVSCIFEAEMSEVEKTLALERSFCELPTYLIRWICLCNERGCLWKAAFISWFEPRIKWCSKHELRFMLEEKTPTEKTHILRTLILRPGVSIDLVLFCLLQLDDDTQQEVLEKVPVKILLCFLTWPFQRNFLDLADRVWSIISPEDFCTILLYFINRMKKFQWQNTVLVEILQEFWQRSPTHFKDYANRSPLSKPMQILLECSNFEPLNINVLEKSIRKYTLEKILNTCIDFGMSQLV